MTDTYQGELWPQLDISIRPWQQPQQAGEAGQALVAGHDDALSRYADAIAKIESAGSGGYSAQGPVTRSGDRAYGRYQIMGTNIPQWTREALGRSLTPEEFLASPQAQDAVFRHKFGSYVAQYGNPADAASAWLTGKPLATGGASRDQLGTSGASYVQKFLDNLGIGAEGGAPLSDNLLAQLPQARQASAVDQLLGLNGAERYQLWPERLAREALSAPHQALTQGFVPGSSDEIAAAQALSNFAGMGSLPLAQRGAVGALGGRLTQVRGPAEAPGGALAPVFYSTAAQTLENAGFNRASPAQWLAYLRNAQGVKGEELEWTGLADRLSNAAESQLTKADLLQHLADNQVDLNEVPKQEFRQWSAADSARLDDLERRRTNLTDAEEAEFQNLVNRENVVSDKQTGRPPDLPKYGSYTLPGAEPGSYREALLQLPQLGRAVDNRRYIYRDPVTGEESLNVGAVRTNNPDFNMTDTRYRSSHWDEPNVLGHVRMNDRAVQVAGQDKPLDALFLEELQSDWHQQGRREGYAKAVDHEALNNANKELMKSELELKSIIEGQNRRADNTIMQLQHAWEAKQFYDRPDDLAIIRRQLKTIFGDDALNAANKYLEAFEKKSALQDEANSGVPNAPFKTSWPELLLKRMIREAAESGKDALAWTSGETQASRYDLSKQVEEIRVLRHDNGQYDIAGVPKGETRATWLGKDIPENKLADYVGKDLANKAVSDIGGEPGSRSYSGLDLRVGGEGMLKFYDDMLPKVAQKIAKKYGGKVELGETNTKVGEHLTGLAGESDRVPVHVMRLTPELRKAALSQGFPLFQAGVPLSIAAPNGRVHTLTPVSHDPFADQQILKGNAT